MKTLGGSLRQATEVRQAQAKIRNLSKCMTLGTDYRLFFPICRAANGEADIVTAAVPGRKLDFSKLGSTFFCLGENYDVDQSGTVLDLTGVKPYARIARVFHSAEAEAEKENAKDEAAKAAKVTGTDIDVISLNAKLTEIERTYFGDRNAKPSPVYATVNPMIQGIVIEVATECLVVPLDKTSGAPMWNDAAVASFSISSRKAKDLLGLVANKDYCPEDAQYLECGWSWKGASNKEAGADARLQGISKDLSLANKFPELWESGKDNLDKIAKTDEVIKSRNLTMSSKVTANEVIENFRKYLAKHPVVLAYINTEDEITKAAAKDIVDFGLVKNVTSIQDKLLAIVNEQNNAAGAEAETAEEHLDAVQMKQASEAVTLGDTVAAVGDDVDKVFNNDGDDIDSL